MKELTQSDKVPFRPVSCYATHIKFPDVKVMCTKSKESPGKVIIGRESSVMGSTGKVSKKIKKKDVFFLSDEDFNSFYNVI